jgi:hypothetical protein
MRNFKNEGSLQIKQGGCLTNQEKGKSNVPSKTSPKKVDIGNVYQ